MSLAGSISRQNAHGAFSELHGGPEQTKMDEKYAGGRLSGGSISALDESLNDSGETEMARLQYIVVHSNNQWFISYDNKHYGPYATQKAAIKEAVDTAHKAGNNGHDAQVLVQGTNNQFRTEWTYGHDPYPPPG